MENSEQLPLKPETAEQYVVITRDIVDTWKGFSRVAVTDEHTCLDAGKMRLLAKTQMKELETLKRAALQPITATEQKIRSAFRHYESLLSSAVEVIDRALRSYQLEEERKRREAQARAEAEAKRDAEERRKALLAQAAEAKEEGDHAVAEVIVAEAAEVVPAVPVIEEKRIKNEAVTFREQWTWECVDFDAVPSKFKVLNEKMLSGVVRAEKDKSEIPGIKVRCEKIPVSNTRY